MGYDQQTVNSGGGQASPFANAFISGLMKRYLGVNAPQSTPYDDQLGKLTDQMKSMGINDPTELLQRGPTGAGLYASYNNLNQQKQAYLKANPAPDYSKAPIFDQLDAMLKGTDTGAAKEAAAKTMAAEQQRNIADLRERYTASGTGNSVGTPAAAAEALYRSDSTPRIATAEYGIDLSEQQLRNQAFASLLGLAGNFADKGTPQATTQTVFTPNSWTSALSALSGAAQGGASVYKDITQAGNTRNS